MTRKQFSRTRRVAVVLSIPLVVAACSKSEESNLDVLAEWRKNAPTTTAPAESDSSSAPKLPSLPEGADPFAEENYRIAAIRSYMTARGHVLTLMELAGEFDAGSETWASGMRDLSKKFKEEAVYFAKLNPSDEYVEKHELLVVSMERISDLIDELDKAISESDFPAGADALAAMQEEANTMVQHGRFDEGAASAPTTVAP